MRVIRHVRHVARAEGPRVVAPGRFDGGHRGHQRILQRVKERAALLGGESLVIVRRDAGEPRLDDRRGQLERLRDAGVDTVVFAPTRALNAAVDHFGAALRVSARGSDAVAPRGGELEEVPAVEAHGAAITSAAIRGALSRGDLRTAAAMLGRDRGVAGRGVRGFRRGAGLGIPTANLRVRGIQLPPDGVYAVRARLADDTYVPGVANVGFHPPFGNQTRTVETHLLDFNGDLYGQRFELAFLLHLRGEQKFAGV